MSSVSVVQGDLSGSLNPRPSVLVDGDPIDSNWVCNTRLISPAGITVIDRMITEKTQDGMRFVVYISESETAALEVDTYTWVIELSNATTTPIYNVEQTYGLEVEPQSSHEGGVLIHLQRGINSFASYAQALEELGNMPTVSMAQASTRTQLKRALLQSWANIGALTVDFENDLYSTSQFTDQELDLLTPFQQKQLLQAQIIEADFLLGGNPIEMRRRMGLMSDSAGESAHFMRPTKPVVLPVCRDAAFALTPYIRYTAIGGR